MNYHKLLLKAREQAELRLQEKGLGPRERKFKTAKADPNMLTPETGQPLISRPEKQTEVEDDFMTSYYNKLFQQNKELKEEIKGVLHEDTGVFEPIDTRSVDISEADLYSADSFTKKLLKSESSGRFNITTVSDSETGEKVFGGFQFSEGRLADYKKATKDKFTTEQFLADPKLQMRVTEWHIADLDELIDTLDRSQFTSRDGLRAVGHLGGRTGLKKFVESGGKYNPKDRFGTSLMKYYNDFK